MVEVAALVEKNTHTLILIVVVVLVAVALVVALAAKIKKTQVLKPEFFFTLIYFCRNNFNLVNHWYSVIISS